MSLIVISDLIPLFNYTKDIFKMMYTLQCMSLFDNRMDSYQFYLLDL